jgi:hypothetical protein
MDKILIIIIKPIIAKKDFILILTINIKNIAMAKK